MLRRTRTLAVSLAALALACDAGSGASGGVLPPDAGATPTDTQSGTDATAAPDAPASHDTSTTPDAQTTVDAGPEADVPAAEATYAGCFPHLVTGLDIDYDALGAVTGSHCDGTNHQAIEGLEKVVFLGDSITAGAPPVTAPDLYKTLLTAELQSRFGPLEVDDCSVGGAVLKDLVNKQAPACFPALEPKRTLVVFTIGGNDIANMAYNGVDLATGKAEADKMVAHLRSVLSFFSDAQRFPAGVFVVFSNVYEFTDGTGKLGACPVASYVGFPEVWPAGIPIFAYLEEGYVKAAVDFGRDVAYLEERFCGHGFANDDPASPCFAPANDYWFGGDCIHPSVDGHAVIADLFLQTILE